MITERNALRDEFRQQEREWNSYLNEQRKARAEAAAAGREERQKEYEERQKLRKIEALDEQPHVAEITLIEQTILWCNANLPKKVEKSEEVKKDTSFNNPDGSMILLKKDAREEEFYFAPTKGKKGPKGKKGKEEGSGGATIKH